MSLETRSSRWPLVLSLASLAFSSVVWLQMRHGLDDVRTAQRQLASDVRAARSGPVLDITGAPALGAADAPVTLVEFADYECPYCIRHFTQTMPRIEAAFIRTGKVRYVFRDFPIDALHPGSIRAHEAAHCALEQDKFWDLHPRLFSAPGTHDDAALAAAARDAGLKMAAFTSCLSSGRTEAAVRQNVETVTHLGATGTPTFFVGVRDTDPDHVRIVKAMAGAQPYEEFAKALADVGAEVQ